MRYSNLYPGIDLIFYFRDGQLEYDIIASPGADPSAISFQTEGADTSLTREGDVAIKVGARGSGPIAEALRVSAWSEARRCPQVIPCIMADYLLPWVTTTADGGW